MRPQVSAKNERLDISDFMTETSIFSHTVISHHIFSIWKFKYIFTFICILNFRIVLFFIKNKATSEIKDFLFIISSLLAGNK